MNKQGVLSRLFGFMGGFKYTMLLSGLFSAVSAVLSLYSYVCVYLVARELLQVGGDFSSLSRDSMTALGWRAVFYISFSFGMYGIALLFSHITAYNTVARVRIQLMEHIGALPLGYHVNNASGKLRKIIEKNTDSLESLIAHQLPDLVQSIVLPFAFLGFMFVYDWRLSLICLLPVILGFCVLASMLKGTSEGLARQYQKSAEDISNAATEYVRGISVVKVFGQTARSFQRYQRAVKEYTDYVVQYALSMKNSDSLYNAIINGIFLFLIPGGIILYYAAQDTERMILSFIFFAVLIPAVVTILNRIMKSASNMMVAGSALDAIDEILQQKTLQDPEQSRQPSGHDIRFDNVSFCYEEGSEKALNQVTFSMDEGTVTALVGASGSGKSTAANLIARLWDAQEGQILIGGIDVQEMSYQTLMEQISIVFQENSLFKMSIADNVAFYTKDASRQEILRALHLAQCDDILEKLPNGADTVIGTKGVYLSGGEMQRIALARAILKDAPIVLLDEATAFADAENEHLIQKALDELLRGKTVLMVAHRLSTVIGADQICVMEHGRIAERGTHKELLRKNGLYANMYREYQSSISWKIGGNNHV